MHAQDCISANAVDRSASELCIILTTFTTPELAACHDRAHPCSPPRSSACPPPWPAELAATLTAASGRLSSPTASTRARFAAAAGADAAARAAAREALAATGSAATSSTVGGIEPRKGSLDLLSAYARLAEPASESASEPGLRLVIAGGETLFDYRDYRAAWDKLAAELDVAPLVLGPVAQDELPSLVAAADVFCFPSVKEGFGLAAMEALAAGVPVVTRDLPVLREVFRDTVRFASDPAGFADQMRAALGDPGSHRAAGLALAKQYTWDAAAKAHLCLYNSLYDRHAR